MSQQSTSRALTRAEIYERIKASSRQEVILEEMQRLGFWPKADGEPRLAAEHIEREAHLQRELAELRAQIAVRENPERALRQMRKQRMQQALAQREETKRQQARLRHEKALDWHARRATHVGYLGPGVSAALSPAASQGSPARKAALTDAPKLIGSGLPVLESAAQMAQAMGVTVAELRFLSFHREVARSHHYHSFTLPKKTGGQRLISAPMPRLKRAQYWVLDNILGRVPAHEAAHGFLAGRSILSNALPHLGRDVVINLDVRDFFPSISFARIKGVFVRLGYGEAVATVLALLCSENRAQAWQVDGERLFIGGKARERVLPQGAPTSPMLTNLLCRRLDRRLQGLASQLGFAYTRYADDLTFSASGEAARDNVGRLLGRVRWILRDEGFTPHPEKERVMRKGRRQEVTGVVVNNAQPGSSRQMRKQLRAALHQAARHGAGASDKPAHWQGQTAQVSQLLGLAQFVHQINPRQGLALVEQARSLGKGPLESANQALTQAAREDRERKAASAGFRRSAAQGQAPVRANGQPWWQPAPAEPPVLEQTDQQRRELRQQARREMHSLQAGSSAQAASGERAMAEGPTPAPAVQSQAAHETAPPTSGPALRRLLTYWAQIVVCFVLGNLLHTRVVTLVGIALVVVLYYRRKQGWGLFFAAMVLAVLVGMVFKQ